MKKISQQKRLDKIQHVFQEKYQPESLEKFLQEFKKKSQEKRVCVSTPREILEVMLGETPGKFIEEIYKRILEIFLEELLNWKKILKATIELKKETNRDPLTNPWMNAR